MGSHLKAIRAISNFLSWITPFRKQLFYTNDFGGIASLLIKFQKTEFRNFVLQRINGVEPTILISMQKSLRIEKASVHVVKGD